MQPAFLTVPQGDQLKRSRLEMTFRISPDGQRQTVFGRDAWALDQLIAAGASGCTPITHPGPRWSRFVKLSAIFSLRDEHGLIIKTVHENHGGQFAGSHARYILRSQIEIVSRSDREETRRAA